MTGQQNDYQALYRDVVWRAGGALRMRLKDACKVLNMSYQTVQNRRSAGTWDNEKMRIDADPLTGRLFVSCSQIAQLLVGHALEEPGGTLKPSRGRPSLKEACAAERLGITVKELRGLQTAKY